VIVNYPEVAVRSLIGEVLDGYANSNPGICRCERCLDDIMALALNNLPAKYVVTDQGAIITGAVYELIGGKAQVIAAIASAIQRVQQNPRH